MKEAVCAHDCLNPPQTLSVKHRHTDTPCRAHTPVISLHMSLMKPLDGMMPPCAPGLFDRIVTGAAFACHTSSARHSSAWPK